jgi:hypothetical protein
MLSPTPTPPSMTGEEEPNPLDWLLQQAADTLPGRLGAEMERERIVAWLRGNEFVAEQMGFGALSPDFIAAAISRGDHIPTGEER